MATKFSVGDHVRWNSEAGHVQGTITAVHAKDVAYKGHRDDAAPTIRSTRSRATRRITWRCTRATR